MIENSRVMGELLLNNLISMKRDYIKEVRGKVDFYNMIEFKFLIIFG
jgi:hypothetical protein